MQKALNGFPKFLERKSGGSEIASEAELPCNDGISMIFYPDQGMPPAQVHSWIYRQNDMERGGKEGFL